MNERRISPLKAIRLKCLECSCGSSEEVRRCPIKGCSLYPFRLGKNPFRTPISPERSEALRQHMAQMRAEGKL